MVSSETIELFFEKAGVSYFNWRMIFKGLLSYYIIKMASKVPIVPVSSIVVSNLVVLCWNVKVNVMEDS